MIQPKKTLSLALLLCTQFLCAADFSQLQLHNSGRGGSNTPHGLARFDSEVLAHAPDTVIIFFGMNDSINDKASVPLDKFRANLTEMVRRSKANDIAPFLVTVHPIIAEPLYERHPDKLQSFYLDRGGANAIIDRYNPVIREVAQETNTPLIDFAVAAAEHLKDPQAAPIVVPDGVHLAPAGKKLLGDTIASALASYTPQPKKVVCFGDSITRLGYDTELYLALDPDRFQAYTTSIPSAKAHPDLEPPTKLFDGKYENISLDSIEYRGDVDVLVDLDKTSMIHQIEVVYFSAKNYTLSEINLYAGLQENKMTLIESFPVVPQKEERKARTATFQLNKELRYFKIHCKRAESSARVLISEIMINGKDHNSSEW
ncbi:GDSL-type esterase/lipase family protein [Coraliomargarita algicola]|uniref:GDSL-type esterase/lipase family protein n=1 Tax=Coraliomargarita algicola TaxID=3092156 RepID=A0ABZ0RMZ8_9BACT|nr:GDSL-type esterase/lipase family protein [Coraliomargarita sp. J2-16]WPJ96781.1 GDSL-type esterase/lipase family protein [Coraliomargarita sp. J2-16]